MTHVVQFTNLDEFITDLAAGDVAAIYHDLHEQRISAIPKLGLSTWLLVTVIRAIVANGRIVHAATLTIPHGRAVEHHYGKPFHPDDEANEPARWHHARDEHADIIDHLLDQLARHGLMNLARPGILNVPADLPLVLATNPLNEPVDQLIADAAADYSPGGAGSPG